MPQVSAAGDKDLALKVYQQCNSGAKIIGVLAEKGDFNALVGAPCLFPLRPTVPVCIEQQAWGGVGRAACGA